MKLTSLAISAIIVLAFSSCKTNSTGPSTNPTDTTQTSTFNGRGSDYFPLTATDVVSAHIRGTESTYDLNGSLTDSKTIDQDRTAFVMGATTLLGLPAFSIGAYDDNGAVTNSGEPSFQLALSNGTVYAGNKNSNSKDKSLILPAALSIGLSWNPDPKGDPRGKITLTNHLASYTDHNGNTYQDVIQVEGTYADSSNEFTGREEITVIKIGATFYFAKDVGLIDINVHQWDEHQYNIDANGIHDYERDVLLGTATRNK